MVFSPANSSRAVGVAEQQAQRFGRGQQDLRRPDALARLAVGRRVAGAGLDPDRQAHLLDRGEQVALDVDRQRLQRRDVERVQALGRAVRSARQMVGRKPASVLPAPVAATSSALRPARARVEHVELVAARLPAARREPVLDDRREALLAQRPSVLFAARARPRPRKGRAVACSVCGRWSPAPGCAVAQHRRQTSSDQQDDRADDRPSMPQSAFVHMPFLSIAGGNRPAFRRL